jgi:hypothetical protein
MYLFRKLYQHMYVCIGKGRIFFPANAEVSVSKLDIAYLSVRYLHYIHRARDFTTRYHVLVPEFFIIL